MIFKQGDYVECVSNTRYLTVGKVYRVEEVDGLYVVVQNDQETLYRYIRGRFKLTGKLIEREWLDG